MWQNFSDRNCDSCVCRGDQKEAKCTRTTQAIFLSGARQEQFHHIHMQPVLFPRLYSRPSFHSASNIEAVLCRQPSPSEPVLLCTKHYRDVHRKLASPPACKSCGTQPKPGTGFTGHSPDALTICSHLQNTVGMDIVLQPSDKICAMCYKAHVAILKSLEEQLNTPVKKVWTYGKW